MAPDTGKLDVDVPAARTATGGQLARLAEHRATVEAAAPTRAASDYGQGLADRAAQLTEMRRRAHGVRLAHLDRLRAGLESALATVDTVSATDGVSDGVFAGGRGGRQ